MLLDKNGNITAGAYQENYNIGQLYPSATYARSGNATRADGIMVGANIPRWEEGKFSRLGKALSFDGSGDYVEVPNSSSLSITNQITIECWVKPAVEVASSNAQAVIVEKPHDSHVAPYYDYHIFQIDKGRFYFGLALNGVWRTAFSSANAIPIGKFTHIAATYDGNSLNVYANGVLVGQSFYSGTIGTSTKPLRIGTHINVSGDYFNGVIDDVRIWNIARTQQQIQSAMFTELDGTEIGLSGYWKMNEGIGSKVRDYTFNHNDGVIYNATWTDGPSFGLIIDEETVNYVYNSDFEVLDTRIAEDRFTRADSITALGNASETNQAWTANSGTWGISSNQAYNVSDVDGALASLDSGIYDGVITCDVTGDYGSTNYRLPLIVFRMLDANNYLAVQIFNGAIYIKKKDAGTYTNLTSASTTIVNGAKYTIKIVCIGNYITVYKGETWAFTHILSGGDTKYAGSTYTKVGMSLSKLGTPTYNARWSNFNVSKLPATRTFFDDFNRSQTVTFNRNLAAYEPMYKTTAATGVPRYMPGRFQNLLTQAQSDMESGVNTGFSNMTNTTIVQDNTTSWQGANSMKVICGGVGSSEGVVVVGIPVYRYVAHTASVYIKGSGTVQLWIRMRSVDGTYTESPKTLITLNNTWTRYSSTGTPIIPAKDLGQWEIHVRTDITQATTFWIDGVQLEEGSVATEWRTGGKGKAIWIEEDTKNLVRNSDFETMIAGKQRAFYDTFDRVATPTFTRASIAYKKDGTQVSSGSVRYEYGRFQNMTKTGADFESTAPGWVFGIPGGYTTPATYTAALSTASAYQSVQSALLQISGTTLNTDGIRVYRYIQNSGAATADACAMGTFVPGRTYTASIYLNVTQISNAEIAFTVYQDGANMSNGITPIATTTSGWTRYSIQFTPSDITTSIYVSVRLKVNVANGTGTVYADNFQVEEGSTATAWRMGGAGMGVVVEEGTTNMLTANQSDVETDTTGWYGVGANSMTSPGVTLFWDNTVYYGNGTASLKVVTDGTKANQGFTTNFSPRMAASASTPYTMQLRIKGTAGTTIQLQGNGNIVNYNSSIFTLTGGWDLLTHSFTTNSSETNIAFTVFVSNTSATTFWADKMQLEQKAYATSWVIGGTPRNAEVLTIPTNGQASSISVSAGTWEQWVYVNNVSKRQIASTYNAIFQIPKAAGTSGIVVFHNPGTANWTLETKDDTDASLSTNVLDTETPDGWNLFTVTWTSSAAKIYINGVLKGTIANPKLPTAFYANAYIGYNGATGGHYLNTVHDAIRVSNIVRSDAEILAYYNATDKPTPDNNTVIILNFDNDLDNENIIGFGWSSTSTTIKGNMAQILSANTPYTINPHGDNEWKDIDMSVDIKPINMPTSSANAGVIIRYNDNNNLIAVVLFPTTIQAWKRVAGSWSQIGTSAAYTTTVGNTHTMRVTIVGTAANVYMNGSGTASLTFTIPTDITWNGKVGMYCNYADALFDNFEVKVDMPDGWYYYGGQYGGATTTIQNRGFSALTTGANGIGSYAIKRTVAADTMHGGSMTDIGNNPPIIATANTTYTAQFKIKGTYTGLLFQAQCLDTNGTHLGYIGSTYFTTIATTWTQTVVTFTTLPNTAKVNLIWVKSSSGANGDWYAIDQVQLEQKPYATSYQRNDSLLSDYQRNIESLTSTTTGFSPTAGTWEGWVYLTDTSKRQPLTVFPRIFELTASGGLPNGYIVLRHSENTAEWKVLSSNGATQSQISAVDSLTPNGWNHFAVTWSATKLELFINGVSSGTPIATPSLPSAFDTVWYLGGNTGGSNILNAAYDDIRVSNVVRTSTEITNSYNSTYGHAIDANTVCIMRFDDDLDCEVPIAAAWTDARTYNPTVGFRIKNNKAYIGYRNNFSTDPTQIGYGFWDAQLIHGDAEWTDVDISCKVTIKAGNQTNNNIGTAGIVIRSNGDANNHLKVALQSNNYVNVDKRVGGAGTTITSVANTVTLGTEYTLRVVVIGMVGYIYVNGTPLTSFVLPSDVPTQGKVGLYASYGEVTFDDIEVKSPVPSVWTLPTMSTTNNMSAISSGYNGTKALKLTAFTSTYNTVNSSNCEIAAGQTYTVSFWYKIPTTSSDMCYITFADGTPSIYPVNIWVKDGTWHKATGTFTASTTTTCVIRFYAHSATAYPNTVYVDSVQFENKGYATSYMRNDNLTTSAVRNVELLTVPTTNVFTSSQGTVEMWVKRNRPWYSYGFLFQADGTGNTFHVEHNSVGVISFCVGGLGSGPTTGYTCAVPVGTWMHLAFRWDDATKTAHTFENGVLKKTISYTNPVTTANVLGIGSSASSTYITDMTFDSFRVSKIARSDADILASYNSTKKLMSDSFTTFNLDFNNNLYSHNDIPILYKNNTLYLRGSVIQE